MESFHLVQVSVPRSVLESSMGTVKVKVGKIVNNSGPRHLK